MNDSLTPITPYSPAQNSVPMQQTVIGLPYYGNYNPAAAQFFQDCLNRYEYVMSMALSQSAENARNAYEIGALQNELQNRKMIDDAMTQLYCIQDNAYHAQAKHGRGRMVKITDFVFDSVFRFEYDDLFGKKPELGLVMSNQTFGCITEEDFNDNKKFLLWLERKTHTCIQQYDTLDKIAWLLQSIVERRCVKSVMIPFHGGWLRTEQEYCYFTSPEFRTDARASGDELVRFTEKHTTYGNALPATKRFIEKRLTGFQFRDLRTICLLWLHASFLSSLWSEQGLKPLKVLSFSDLNAVQQKYLSRFFSPCGADSVSLSVSPGDFAYAFAARKDQPLVIIDSPNIRNSRENIACLRRSMLNGSIEVKREDVNCTRPVRTMPVVISGEYSSVLGVECNIPIRTSRDDFECVACADSIQSDKDDREYWSCFVAYTSAHLLELYDFLKDCRRSAWLEAYDRDLSPEGVDTLAVMDCMAAFLKRYYDDIPLDHNLTEALINNRWRSRFLNALEEGNAEYMAPDGAAEAFIDAARAAIEKKLVQTVTRTETFAAKPHGVVFYDNLHYYFDNDVFKDICDEAGLYPPDVKRDLDKRGFFAGSTVNGETFKSRIRLKAQGASRERFVVNVYQFNRKHFKLPDGPFSPEQNSQVKGIRLNLGHSAMGEEVVRDCGNNAHIFVSGQTGTGKSTLLRHCIMQLPQQGVRVIIFDYAGDFRPALRLQAEQKGIPCDCFDIRSQVGIDPFGCVADAAEDSIISAARITEAIINSYHIRASRQPILLRKALKEYINSGADHLCLSDFIKRIEQDPEQAEEMAPVLERVQELNDLLPQRRDGFRWNLENPGITLLSFGHLHDESTQAIATEFLLFELWSLKKDYIDNVCPTVIVLDECQRLSFGPKSICCRMLREGRKYQFWGWLATQWLNDDDGIAAMDQVGLQAHFYPGERDARRLAKHLCRGNNRKMEGCMSMLDNLNPGQFVYLNATGPTVCTVPKDAVRGYEPGLKITPNKKKKKKDCPQGPEKSCN